MDLEAEEYLTEAEGKDSVGESTSENERKWKSSEPKPEQVDHRR